MTQAKIASASPKVLFADVLTQGHSPGRTAGPGRWEAEVVWGGPDELPDVYSATGQEAEAHANRMFLKSAAVGLAHAVEHGAAVVTIHIGLKFMADSGDLIPVWRERGWIGLLGEPLSNADILEEIYQLSQLCLAVHWVFQPSAQRRRSRG